MKQARRDLFDHSGRAPWPTLYEPTQGPIGPRRPIGFERELQSGIEVVRQVPVEELRKVRQLWKDQRESNI